MLNMNQWGSNFVRGLYFSLVAEMNIFMDFPGTRQAANLFNFHAYL